MAKKLNEIYKCSVCGSMVEVVRVGDGALSCCGQEMVLQIPNTVEASGEKHIPVIEKTSGGVKVKIGAVPHPMEAAHHIEWIEAIAGDRIERKYLNPGAVPEAEFNFWSEDLMARENCNLHGLWQNK